MNIFEFMDSSPWLTFLLGLFVVLPLTCVMMHYTYCITNRELRRINILIRGYPPEHCNADGENTKCEDCKHEGEV